MPWAGTTRRAWKSRARCRRCASFPPPSGSSSWGGPATSRPRSSRRAPSTAIGALFPTAVHPVLVLDGGANVDCDARELVGFAHLGSVYVRDVLDRPQPGVGLLNVGEEDEKGNAVVKEAHQLLKQAAGIHYV